VPVNVMDRRVQKTRKLLQDALVDLVSEKGFESVTVQEVLDKANVGRSTFYTHFQDKEELLHSCFEGLGKLFEDQGSRPVKNNDNRGDSPNDEFILNVFGFVGRNHRLFKALLGRQGIAMFNHPIYDFLFAYMQKHIEQPKALGKGNSFQKQMVAHYFTSAFIGVLRWWVEQDMPCTAEDMGKYFRMLSATGFEDATRWT
jgi:AcrR family transcriptional regulator